MTVKNSPLKIGDKIPSFHLPSTGGKEFKLNNYKNKNLVLFFYPKDSTPGCTLEGKDFTHLQKDFQNANTEVFGISRDSIKSHENFKSKQCYEIDLLSDGEEKACQIFSVIKEKNLYGRISKGIERSTFFINGKGHLIQEWRGVKVPGHAKEVLSYVQNWRGEKAN